MPKATVQGLMELAEAIKGLGKCSCSSWFSLNQSVLEKIKGGDCGFWTTIKCMLKLLYTL